MALAPGDGGDDFHPVACLQRVAWVFWRGDETRVDRHGVGRPRLHGGQRIGHGGALGQIVGLALMRTCMVHADSEQLHRQVELGRPCRRAAFEHSSTTSCSAGAIM